MGAPQNTGAALDCGLGSGSFESSAAGLGTAGLEPRQEGAEKARRAGPELRAQPPSLVWSRLRAPSVLCYGIWLHPHRTVLRRALARPSRFWCFFLLRKPSPAYPQVKVTQELHSNCLSISDWWLTDLPSAGACLEGSRCGAWGSRLSCWGSIFYYGSSWPADTTALQLVP